MQYKLLGDYAPSLVIMYNLQINQILHNRSIVGNCRKYVVFEGSTKLKYD